VSLFNTPVALHILSITKLEHFLCSLVVSCRVVVLCCVVSCCVFCCVVLRCVVVVQLNVEATS
jgi:hypothetical protein